MAKLPTHSAPTPAAHAPATSIARSLAKRALIGGAGLLAILLIVFFLLPQWISDDQGRAYVLQQLNKRMDATLAVSNWSVGWFHGSTLTGVTVTLPDGTTLLTCPAIHSELTLWGIIRGNYDMGTTTADALQLHVLKHIDGSTSLDALLGKGGAARARIFAALRTLRGSLRAKSAVVSATSEATQESIVYSNVNAAITIASSDSPFHVEINAIEPERSFSLGATLPPIAEWSAHQPNALIAASDFDLNAMHLPARLLCDFTGLDPRWKDSVGMELSTLSVSNHESPLHRASMFSCLLRGSDARSSIDAKLLLYPPTASSATFFSLPPAAPDCHFSAALSISSPLARLLAQTDPVFTQLESGDGPLHLTLSRRDFFSRDSRARQGIGAHHLSPSDLPPRGIDRTISQSVPARRRLIARAFKRHDLGDRRTAATGPP